ncbi:DNA-binding transcriptional regulator MetR [Klebsiella pneumoniae]|uniref:DNA-binding transcriptional regulator MetR n=1 Tax=Klebsiella pneumoniae TaxID=573 RepID=A0A2X3F3M8_KLEPN|nr:DNA-binding transcriptional regulator MetR [Klebsiella pneumoniae]
MFDFEVRLVLAPEHPLAMKTLVTPEDLAAETLLIYPVQRGRLDIWRHFLQPAGISPQLKSVDKHAVVDPDGGCPDGHRRAAALGGGKL